MTSERVRVFRSDGEFETDRIAVWGGTEWVELECDSVTVIDGEGGALAAVILPAHVGHDLSTPAFAKRRKPGPSRLAEPDAAREQVEDVDERPIERNMPPPDRALPVWGDSTKRVRFFTITTEDGRVIPNHATDVAGSPAAAAEHVRLKWNRLVQGQSGKAAVKVELQPEGRIGSDRPDIAPPKPVAHVDEDGPDKITVE